MSENKYSLICSTFTGTLNQLRHFILFVHLSSHFIFQFLHVVLWSTLACLLERIACDIVCLGGHPAKYWPPTIVCVVCVCVCVLLCLVFIIAVRLVNKVIFYQLSALTLQVTVNYAMSH